MECSSDPQVLKDANDNIFTKEVSVFLRYPHSQIDKVDGACLEASTASAAEVIHNYNLFNKPPVKLHHVNVTKVHGDSDTECQGILEGGACHWQWKGTATYECYVVCE